MNRWRLELLPLAVLVLASRLCHVDVLWIEECYPAAGALQLLHGKLLYRDIWFDKPPLAPLLYTLIGAHKGWLLRVAGGLFVVGLCWLAGRWAAQLWGSREASLASWLTACALTFWIPAAVIPLAPDLLLLAPHLWAAYLAWTGRAVLCGAVAGIGVWLHPKGAFLLLVVLLWQWRAATRVAAGFALTSVLFTGWLHIAGAWEGYIEQVWRWGSLYAADTYVQNPWRELARRTCNWAGFHATLVLGALAFWTGKQETERWRWLLWVGVAYGSVIVGLRFFPRYYLQLLPPMVLMAARGLARMERRRRWAVLALLALPILRFGSKHWTLGQDVLAGRRSRWRDLAMYYSSRDAAEWIRKHAQPGDTLFVWGYRPDIYVETRLPAGSRFLDSQPLTGVIADRHLTESRCSAPEVARANRLRLRASRPTWVVDGLGPYNPALAITQYPDLADWLRQYRAIAHLPGAVIYRFEPAARFTSPANTAVASREKR